MEQYKRDFIEFALSRNVLKFGEFTLKSGRKSPYFFNAGLFNTGADLARLGEFYAAAIQASAVDFDVVFGPAYKGIPIGTSVSVALFNRYGIDKPVCFNRKEVITAGTAIRESMELISANQAELAAVLIALNRKERGKGELSAIQEVERDYQCQVLSIIDLDDLMQFIEQDPRYSSHLPEMRAYRAEFGV